MEVRSRRCLLSSGLLLLHGQSHRRREAPRSPADPRHSQQSHPAHPLPPRSRLLADAKLAKKEKKRQLVEVMERDLPDFRMQASCRPWGDAVREAGGSGGPERRGRPPHAAGRPRCTALKQRRDPPPDGPASQLRWELGSPLFGLLLRHFAPDDTYTVHKARGARVGVV